MDEKESGVLQMTYEFYCGEGLIANLNLNDKIKECFLKREILNLYSCSVKIGPEDDVFILSVYDKNGKAIFHFNCDGLDKKILRDEMTLIQ